MPVIVACTELKHIDIRAQSQGCRTRLEVVASTWLRAEVDKVDIICVDVLMEYLGGIIGTEGDQG